MSSRITYGKRGRKLGTKLQPAVEFSPKKQNSIADGPLTTSSDTLESDNAPLTSPFSTPKKKKNAAEKATPDVEHHQFDYGVFDLNDEEPKPAISKRINRTRTKVKKPMKAKEEPKLEIPRSPTSSLGSFFVESSVKPTWSPSKSNSASPKKDNKTIEPKPPNSSFSKTLNKLQVQSENESRKSPKRPLKVQESQDSSDVWNLLPDFSEQQPKKKTMILKEKDVEMTNALKSDSVTNSQENELINFFNTQQTEFNILDHEPSTPVPDATPFTKESTASPRIPKSIRTYGLQRSYLLEKQNQDEHQGIEGDEELDITLTSEHDITATEGLKTITNLRAQGENAQFVDELNFLIEGIESTATTSSLLELALKLFDDEFSTLLKHHGLPALQKHIDPENKLQVFVLGFIECKITEGGDGKLQFDQDLINVVVSLLGSTNPVDVTKESKGTKAIFKEFKEKLDRDYTPAYFGLTLLIHNGLFINKEIFNASATLFKDLILRESQDIKMVNMILLLFESYLSSSTTVDPQFRDIVALLVNLRVKDENCEIAILKVLIVLSVKKFEGIFSNDLVDKSIESSVQKSNTSVGLLELGLLINLVENDNCCERALYTTNLKRLYRLHFKLKGESRDYFSLLIGIILTKKPEKLSSIFNKNDIKEIASQLQNFNTKGNKLISLQVEEIISKIHKLKVL